ncbi:MAG: molybdopterin-dependent oxidoreductase [Sphingobium sp.]|nr:molybdopterin-dependent oxidoreductase [Sphingobium sp.]MCP5400071.1 molybdopterin-dependent oxidoreductase [Sphingomonas sp.]
MTERRYSFCRICEPHCPLVAEIEGGQIAALLPDHDHPVGGTACHKGLTFLDVHRDPDRVDWPLRRTNAKTEPARFERADWTMSIADIGARLTAIRNEHGPNAIATYVGNPAAFNTTLGMSLAHLLGTLDTRMTFSASTQDCTNKGTGAWAVYGSYGSQPIPDIYNTHYLLCLGANPRVSHWTLVATPSDPDILRQIKRRGGKVLFVNPRKIETSTEETGETLRIIPGTDVYFLAALLNEIDSRTGFANPMIEQFGKNLDALREFVSRYPAERVAPVVGVNADAIRQVAADIIAAPSAAVYISIGVNQSRQGQLCYWLAEMINFVTGNLGKRGGTSKPAGLFDKYNIQSLANLDTSIGSFDIFDPPLFPASLPATILPELIEAGDIKALLVFSGNPLLTVGGEDKLRAAFEKLDLLVTLDLFRNATGELADYVLPTTDWLEREDIISFSSGMQTIPYVQYTEALAKRSGERRTEAWIIAHMMQAMDLPPLIEPADGEVPQDMLLDRILAGRGLSAEQMKALPHQTMRFDNVPPESFYERCLHHPDGKIDCYPDIFVRTGLIKRCDDIFTGLAAEAPDSLKLVTLRTPYMHNSWMANVERLRSGKHAINPLHMCEADAASRGLHNGDLVRVHNENGEVVTRLEINNELRTGVVAMSHGYGHATATGLRTGSAKPGVNYNRLVPTGLDAFEPVSNMSWMSGLPVAVERCTTP